MPGFHNKKLWVLLTRTLTLDKYRDCFGLLAGPLGRDTLHPAVFSAKLIRLGVSWLQWQSVEATLTSFGWDGRSLSLRLPSTHSLTLSGGGGFPTWFLRCSFLEKCHRGSKRFWLHSCGWVPHKRPCDKLTRTWSARQKPRQQLYKTLLGYRFVYWAWTLFNTYWSAISIRIDQLSRYFMVRSLIPFHRK